MRRPAAAARSTSRGPSATKSRCARRSRARSAARSSSLTRALSGETITPGRGPLPPGRLPCAPPPGLPGGCAPAAPSAFGRGRSELTSSARPARARSSLGHDLVQVADDAEVGEVEDGGVRVLVDRDDHARACIPTLCWIAPEIPTAT